MKKMLMTASVPSMIGQFNMNNIHILIELGYEVHVACDFNDISVWTEERIKDFENELEALGVKRHQVDFTRNPLSVRKNLRSLKQINEILKKQHFTFIHCHTPIAGVISRIAANGNKIKVIYTAHGFHFYKGAALKNWLIYYPIERFLSQWTDILITINREDYERAKKSFKTKKILYIPGVGIDTDYIESINCDKKRVYSQLGIGSSDKMIVSVGELSRRKNHEVVIRALGKMQNSSFHYFICGTGSLEDKLKRIAAELGISDNIHFLGFRKDIFELLKASDLFVFPSLQEGLPVALMEAMACRCNIVCSRIRGNIDLIKDKNSLVMPKSVVEYEKAILRILSNEGNEEKRYEMEELSILKINESMKSLYSQVGK